MPLIDIEIPSPQRMRGGWAALAAVYASRGWGKQVYATSNEWLFHDGGGNWVCLRFKSENQAILVGHDHEYSDTYFGEAAEYFGEEEIDLLAEAPDWWNFNLSPLPFGEWIGFIYGWDGQRWQRAAYDVADGFEAIGLLKACSLDGNEYLKRVASDAPGLQGQPPSDEAIQELIVANGNITYEKLEKVVPGWDIDAGVVAARRFI